MCNIRLTVVNKIVTDERMFAMEILKKQCKDLLLPKCEIKLSTKLGEGM